MENGKNIKNVTLVLGKKITLITNHTVQDFNMNLFNSIIEKFDIITLVGLSKPAKKDKYSNMLLNNNFTISKVNYNDNAGFEGKNSDVINFSIEFKK